MNTHIPPAARRWSLLVPLALIAAGCEADTGPTGRAGPPRPGDKPGEVKKVQVGPNVTLEILGEKRRVLIDATVCLEKGALEQLLTREKTKEHEAVLKAAISARDVHKALLLTGAQEGSPVTFEPKYKPATGPVIKVTLEYEKDGKKVSVPAQQWVRDLKTQKPMAHDWVFAGSRFVENPLDPGKKRYLAEDGDVICVSNFESALLDLPIKSSDATGELSFEVNEKEVPPLDTKVTVILEPVLKK